MPLFFNLSIDCLVRPRHRCQEIHRFVGIGLSCLRRQINVFDKVSVNEFTFLCLPFSLFYWNFPMLRKKTKTFNICNEQPGHLYFFCLVSLDFFWLLGIISSHWKVMCHKVDIYTDLIGAVFTSFFFMLIPDDLLPWQTTRFDQDEEGVIHTLPVSMTFFVCMCVWHAFNLPFYVFYNFVPFFLFVSVCYWH